MTTLKPMCLFDLCPDIEGLIQDELDVLLKFREAIKEFKLRIKLNEKCMKGYVKNKHSCLVRRNKQLNISKMIMECILPYVGARGVRNKGHTFNKYANIHGFRWTNKKFWDGGYRPSWLIEPTHEELNDKLTELGYTRFKSKKKPDKLKLLLKHTNEWYKR